MASQTKLNLSNTKFEQTSGSTLNLGGNLIANSFSATTFSLVSVPQAGTSGNTILTRGSDGSIRQISQNLFIPRLLEKKEIPDSTYTLLESDSSKLLIFLNECDVTLPNSIPEDLQFTAANYSSTGATTFNAEGTLNSSDGNVLEGQYAHAYFYKRNATTYVGILPGEGGSSSGSTTSYSFQNGLTETNDIVRLGGSITGNTTLSLESGTGLFYNNSANFSFLGSFRNTGSLQPFNGFIIGSNTEDQNLNWGDFVVNIRNKFIFSDPRGITNLSGGGFSEFSGTSKTGIQYFNFGESNENGDNANYSGLTGTSLVPKKFVEDLLGDYVEYPDPSEGSIPSYQGFNDILINSGLRTQEGGFSAAPLGVLGNSSQTSQRINFNGSNSSVPSYTQTLLPLERSVNQIGRGVSKNRYTLLVTDKEVLADSFIVEVDIYNTFEISGSSYNMVLLEPATIVKTGSAPGSTAIVTLGDGSLQLQVTGMNSTAKNIELYVDNLTGTGSQL